MPPSLLTTMNTQQLEAFSNVIDRIYAAALDPACWTPTMEALADLHRARTAILFTPATPPSAGGYAISHGVSAQEMADWALYVDEDPWVAAATRRNLFQDGMVVLGQDLVPDSELVRSRFYENFLRRYGNRHLCTGVVFGAAVPGQVPVACSLHRGVADSAFDESSRTIHHLVINHLSRAIGTASRLKEAELRLAASLQALEQLQGALLLMGRRGEVLFANPAAMALMGTGRPLRLRTGNPLTDSLGWLEGWSSQTTQEITRELQRVLHADLTQVSHFTMGLAVPKPTGQGSYVVRMARLSPQSDITASLMNAGAIVFISDPDAGLVLEDQLLKRLYGISPAERRVAEGILAGDNLPAIALRLGISENTASTHLKRLFAKTDTHRQSQLVRLLMGLAHQKPLNADR